MFKYMNEELVKYINIVGYRKGEKGGKEWKPCMQKSVKLLYFII